MNQPNGQHEPDRTPPVSRAELVEETIVEEGTDLREYVQVILHRKWLIAFCTLLALVLSAIHLRKAEPVYASTATIKFDPGSSPVVSGFEAQTGTMRVVDEIKTQIEVIQSPKIVRRVIDALGLYGGRDVAKAEEPKTPINRFFAGLKSGGDKLARLLVSFDPEPLDPVVARRQREERLLRDNLEVSQVRDTKVIQITAYDRRPQQASRIADEFCRQYIESLLKEKTEAYRDASSFFSTQLTETRKRLTDAEGRIQTYSGDSKIKVIEQNLEIAEKTMGDLSSEIEKTKNDLSQYKAESETTQKDALLNTLMANDPKYSSMNQRINELKIQRVSLLANNTPDHPDVKKIDKEMEALTTQIDAAVNDLKNESAGKVEISTMKLASLQQRRAEQEELIQRMKRELVDYNIMKGDAESMRELYTALLDRSKKIDLSSEFNPSYVTVLSNAKVPEEPNSPKVGRTVALFGICGLSFGIALVLLVHKLDRSIKEPRVVETRLGLPTLGVVPFLRPAGGLKLFGKKKGARTALVTDYDPKSIEAEAFRVLRTSLQYSSAGHPPKVILLSSCLPQEGKSTVAVNLAISFSQRGDRVIMIDADLKMPTGHKTFGKPRVPGLSDVLAGQQKLDDVIVPSVMPNLDFIPAGPNVPSPGDLLESRIMLETLDELRKRYSLVIVDSAPLSGMADTIVLSKAVDGMCIVVSRGKTPMDALSKVVGTLDRVQAHILGVIYNSRSRSAPEGAAGGNYGYGYGYGMKAEEKA